MHRGLTDVEDHDTDDAEIEDQSSWTTTAERTTGTDEETSTDGSTDGNHMQMALLQRVVELVVRI